MVVKYFSGAECGIDRCLVVALKFVLERFNMKKLIEGNIREDYQLKITVLNFGELNSGL
jgi:hypothetical protein